MPDENPVPIKSVDWPFFDPEVLEWKYYKTQLSLALAYNKVTEPSRKKMILLLHIGQERVIWLTKKVAPKDLMSADVACNYDALIILLDGHFQISSRPSPVAATYKIFSRKQGCRESFAEWSAELQKLVIDCDLENTQWKDKPNQRLLRDLLILNTNDSKLQQKLLLEKDPTVEKVEEMAIAAELHRETLQVIHSTARVEAVHKAQASGYCTQGCDHSRRDSESSYEHRYTESEEEEREQRAKSFKRNFTKGADTSYRRMKSHCSCCGELATHQSGKCPYKDSPQCSRCLRRGHMPQHCTFREVKCHYCQKMGHIKKACRLRKAESVKNETTFKKSTHFQGSNWISEISTERVHETASESTVGSAITAKINVNGHCVTFEVDTGTRSTICDTVVWKSMGSPKLKATNLELCGPGITPLSGVKGQVSVTAQFNGIKKQLPLIVIEHQPSKITVPQLPILGRIWFKALCSTVYAKWEQVWSHVDNMSIPSNVDRGFSVNSGKSIALKTVLKGQESLRGKTLGHCKVKAHPGLEPGSGQKIHHSWHRALAKPVTVKQGVEKVVKSNRSTIPFSCKKQVWIRSNAKRGPRWLPGCIEQFKGQGLYHVKTLRGQSFIRHRDQLQSRLAASIYFQDTIDVKMDGNALEDKQTEILGCAQTSLTVPSCAGRLRCASQ